MSRPGCSTAAEQEESSGCIPHTLSGKGEAMSLCCDNSSALWNYNKMAHAFVTFTQEWMVSEGGGESA